MLRKGGCARCGEALSMNKEAVVVRGRLYHRDHLCCDYCDTQLLRIEESFLMEGMKIACWRCFNKLSPKCHQCKQFIVNEYVLNGGHLYHRNCFKCARCHCILDGEFFEDDEGRSLDRDCLWGQVLMDHIIRDSDNIVLTKY